MTPDKRIHFGERLRSIFDELLNSELEEEASELIRRRRVLDFLVQPGRVSAKVHDEQSRPHRVEILFPQLNDSEWDKVFENMAQQALFLAKLLCSKIPAETEGIFELADCELLPSSVSQLTIRCDDKELTTLNNYAAAVVIKMCEKFESEPFSTIIVRGRGRDETISELQRLRTLLRQRSEFVSEIRYQEVNYEPAPPLRTTIDHYWSSGQSIEELSYSIRADELPASILKWLDPLPLAGLEEHVDFLMEEAYERIARLAQSYGLGL